MALEILIFPSYVHFYFVRIADNLAKAAVTLCHFNEIVVTRISPEVFTSVCSLCLIVLSADKRAASRQEIHTVCV